MKKSLLTIPNAICIVRIALAPVLYHLLLQQKTTTVLILLALVGLSDALDGFLARMLKQKTEFGAMLDSIADYVYYGFFAWWFLITWHASVVVFIPFILMPILLISAAYALMFLRFQKIAFLHLYSSKLTSAVAYVLVVVTIIVGFDSVLFSIALGLWILTSLEMLAASILLKKPQSNIGSILVLK